MCSLKLGKTRPRRRHVANLVVLVAVFGASLMTGITVDWFGTPALEIDGENDRTRGHPTARLPPRAGYYDSSEVLVAPDGLYNPYGLAHHAGVLYAADEELGTIMTYSASTGAFLGRVGQKGDDPGDFDSLKRVAFNGTGHLYAVDEDRAKVIVFDQAGTFLFEFGTEGVGPGQFYHPRGIALNASGHVYVADTLNSRVQVFSPTGTWLQVWNESTLAGGRGFDKPAHITVNQTGYVYVADTFNRTVQVFDPVGQFLYNWTNLGTPGEIFSRPRGIAINSTGQVYVTDQYKHKTYIFDQAGTYLGEFGGNGQGDGQFLYPNGVALDADDNVYVVDRGDRIQEFSPAGQYLATFGELGPGTELDTAIGVARNGTGHVYVTDRSGDVVKIYSPTGQYLTQFGTSGGGPGEFDEPTEIACNGTGHVYVMDSYNDRVQVFTATGVFVRQFACTGYSVGLALNASGHVYVTDQDNDQVAAYSPVGQHLFDFGGPVVDDPGPGEFYDPAGIAINDTGHVHVADYGNDRVQVFDATGTFVRELGGTAGAVVIDRPFSVAINGSGSVYVGCLGNDSVVEFSSAGTYLDEVCGFGSGLGEVEGPRGLHINATGNLLVVDSENHRLLHLWGFPSAPPTLQSVTEGPPNTGALALQWTSVPHALSYAVYRATQPITTIGAGTTLVGTTAGTSLADHVVSGTWYYAVTSTNVNGESLASNSRSATVALPPAAPVLQPITPNPNADGTIQLDWDDAPAGQTYTWSVYRHVSPVNGTSVGSLTPVVTSLASSNYTDHVASGTWYYAVLAVNGTGQALSTNQSVQVTIPPAAPVLQPITPDPSTTGNITLAWMSSAGATSYAVYRHVSPVTTVNASVTLLAPSILTTEYNDTLATNGTYWFSVTASNATGTSPLSNPASVTVGIPPGASPGPAGGDSPWPPWATVVVVIAVVGAGVVVVVIVLRKKRH